MTRKKVIYWEKWGGQEWETMADLARSYNESQGTYQVVMSPVGNWSSSLDLPTFFKALHQGEPPDLIGLENHHIADLAAEGALIPLNEEIKSTELAQTGYLEAFVELGTYNNERYGVPVSGDIVTLYLNLDKLRGTRFSEGSIPATFQEFNSGLRELQARGDIGLIPTYPGWWPQAWIWFFNGTWFDDQGNFTPDHPANLRAYEWIFSLRQTWDLEGFQEPINPIGARDPDPFLAGEIAMVLDGDWLIRRLLRTPKLEWAPAAFPTLKGKPAVLIEADLLSIPSGAREVEGAKSFLRHVMHPASIKEIALGHQKILPLEHWPQSFLERHPNPQLNVYREILTKAQLFHDPIVPGWLKYLEHIKKAFHDIWSGLRTAQQALAAIRSVGIGKPPQNA
jgi:multiple sugar transport system substrate-binding protein